MISGYSDMFRWGGSITPSSRSRVFKVANSWMSHHPVFGAKSCDTWQEAMDHASVIPVYMARL